MKTILIVWFTLSIISTVYGQNRDYSQWWIENHNDYSQLEAGKKDPRVKWAFQVFERVKNVSDKANGRIPRLFIINKKGDPFAQSVPDGGIIINPGIFKICYENTSKAQGDSRLAFILGHELAHLANKDNMSREALQDMKNFSDTKSRNRLRGELKPPDSRTNELLADKFGTLYASMAGFNVDSLFNENTGFFQYWAKQTGAGYTNDDFTRHPSFQKRTLSVRSQMNAVVKRMELFKSGVLLFQSGRLHDAAAAFIEFIKVYPSREVFNNAGACFFTLALDRIHLNYRDEYYRFRLSTAIDYSTTAESMNPRGEKDYLKDKDVLGYINQAIDYFKMAVSRDPYNRTCRLNLAAACILKNEYAEAMAMCDEILKVNSNDCDALNNKAIAFYYYGQKEDLDTTQKSIQILETAHRLKPFSPEILYNLAALKEKRNRISGAKLYWEKYLNLNAIPRDNFYAHAYSKINGKPPSKPSKTAETTAIPPLPAGINPGDDFKRIKKKWKKTINSNWSIGLQVIVKDGIRLLALDDTIEIVEKELNPLEDVAKTLEKYGAPSKVVRHTLGNFYVYKDRGFSIKEKNGKVHSYIWFEKSF